ncbi:hypothetical protein CTAYLR_004081 [Chrysophaeum taylorii]|uniref:5-hmdU DNA kinase helical domain-containing protein n=1 Tax=Chrysophaeum taylorii TaxID=2483200 RepID=A0AAD7URV0_9STRA|nr:hypothetical protein CTAYLR_004081 [Chrysophaeum taylorii]
MRCERDDVISRGTRRARTEKVSSEDDPPVRRRRLRRWHEFEEEEEEEESDEVSRSVSSADGGLLSFTTPSRRTVREGSFDEGSWENSRGVVTPDAKVQRLVDFGEEVDGGRWCYYREKNDEASENRRYRVGDVDREPGWCASDEAWRRRSSILDVVQRGLVDPVAAPYERARVGEAMGDVVYTIHRAGLEPWRDPERYANMSSRSIARDVLEALIDAATTAVPRRLELARAPDFFAASYARWYEERQLDADREAARAAIAAARYERRLERSSSSRRRKSRASLPASLAVRPEVPSSSARVDDASVAKLVAFVLARETVRRNKEAGAPWPWSSDDTLNRYRFTNVRREHDRVTRWLRSRWTRDHSDADARLVLLNCALFRAFGTVAFAEEVGWQSSLEAFLSPDDAVRAAEAVWRRGVHAFTRAYRRPFFNAERGNAEMPPSDLYARAFRRVLRLAEFLQKSPTFPSSGGTWRGLAATIRAVTGFGGTGFAAKELLLDCFGWPSVRDAHVDDGTWTLAGPGARRGLNRVADRALNWGVLAPADSAVEARFVAEIRLIHAAIRKRTHLADLTVHDVQFVLCEYDKYLRATSRSRGSLAIYHPLVGTAFSTVDGAPPPGVTPRPLTSEWHNSRPPRQRGRLKRPRKATISDHPRLLSHDM